MPKIPEFIMIGGIKFTIRVVNQVVSDGDHCAGVCDYDTHSIELSLKNEAGKAYSEALIISTLCHEIAHAALYVTGQHALMKEDQEEALVLALEHIYAPVIVGLCQSGVIKKGEKTNATVRLGK